MTLDSCCNFHPATSAPTLTLGYERQMEGKMTLEEKRTTLTKPNWIKRRVVWPLKVKVLRSLAFKALLVLGGVAGVRSGGVPCTGPPVLHVLHSAGQDWAGLLGRPAGGRPRSPATTGLPSHHPALNIPTVSLVWLNFRPQSSPRPFQ